MPVFHDQGRTGLRRMYLEAWRKHLEGRPLQPLEDQLVRVIEQHPEYQTIVSGGEEMLEQDFTPETGQVNPFLHMGMHLAIREQVGTDRPRGIALVYRELAGRLGDALEAEHRMIDCLGEALWRSQRSGSPPDEAAYLEALRRIRA